MEPHQASPVIWISGSGAPRLGQFLAQQWSDSGATVVLHAHHSVVPARQAWEDLQRAGRRASLVLGDLSDQSTVRRLTAEIVDQWGRIDHFVHTAAIWEPQPLEQLDPASVARTWGTNVTSALWCCQQVGLQMVRQESGGSIVLVGDANVSRPYPDYATYLISKGALTTMVDVMAGELGRRHPRVRVNGVLPGPLELPGDRSAEHRPVPLDANRLGRPVTAAEVAAAIRLLTENEALQGVLLPVAGGSFRQA